MKNGRSHTVIMTVICVFIGAKLTKAEIGYFEGFETSGSGLIGYNSDVTVVASGVGGITSAAGSYHAVISDPAELPAEYNSGAYDTFGANNANFGGGWSSSIDIFIDLNDAAVAAGTYGFDYTVALNGTDGLHAQDNIFHVGALDDGLGGFDVVVNASHNTDFGLNTYKLENSPYGAGLQGTFAESGWYTFDVALSESSGGAIEVDWTVSDDAGSVLWSLTGTSAETVATAGGDRYGWFTYSAAGELAVDNINVIPEPASLVLLGLSGGVMVYVRRRR